jgi:hypothetical protein
MAGESPFWNKMELLANHIRNTNKRVYISDSHMIIDETILIFRRRTVHITKFKNKSIKEDYKNWLLAEYGYI